MARAVLTIISLTMRGDVAVEAVDWIKRANRTPPAAFSALFEGDPDPVKQRMCRDMKLLDAVFAMSLAP